MLDKIIQLLPLNNYYGDSKAIDLAKGYYKIPLTFKEVFVQFKRDMQWQKRRTIIINTDTTDAIKNVDKSKR